MSPPRTPRAWSSWLRPSQRSSNAFAVSARGVGHLRVSASPRRPSPPTAHARVRLGGDDGAPGFHRRRIRRLRPLAHRSLSRPGPPCRRFRLRRPSPSPSFGLRPRRSRHPTSRSARTTLPRLGRLDGGAPNSIWSPRRRPSRPAPPRPAARRGRSPAAPPRRRIPLRPPGRRKRPRPTGLSRHAHARRDAGGAGPTSYRCRSMGPSCSRPSVQPAFRSSSPQPHRSSGACVVDAWNPSRAPGWSRLAVARAPGLPPRAPAALHRARGSPHPAGRPAAALQVRTRGLRSRRLASHLSPSPSRPGGRALDEQVCGQHTNHGSATSDASAIRD